MNNLFGMKYIVSENQLNLIIEATSSGKLIGKIPSSSIIRSLKDSSDVPPQLKLDEYVGTEEYNIIKDISEQIHYDLNNESDFENRYEFITSITENIDEIIKYARLLHYPIHVNKYQDKNGNIFLQARSSVNIDGTKKWVNSYIGSIKDFPQGVDDPNAKRLGSELVRKKLAKYILDLED